MFIASVDAGLERIYPAENPKPKGRMVALNESGTQRIGEDHHRAKLTDAQVEAMREDHERHPVGHPEYMGYRTLAKKYGCSKSTVRDVVNYMKRNQWAVRWSVPRAYRRKHKIP